MKLGLIGTGKMGSALLRGALLSPDISPSDILLYNRTSEHMQPLLDDFPDMKVCASPADIFNEADVILLAIKPQGFCEFLSNVWHKRDRTRNSNPLLISIAAGITINQMEEACPGLTRIIRVMPNTPSLIGKGVSAVCAKEHSPVQDLDTVCSLLARSGTVVRIPEKQIDAVSSISGCGPAYMYVIMDALSEAGVALGLPRPLALQLAAETMKGSAELVLQSGRHPMALRDDVTSPGGTTIAALNILDQYGLRNALIQAAKTAAEKSAKLAPAKPNYPSSDSQQV